MKKPCKYIIVDACGNETVIIFANHIEHSSFKNIFNKITSAGFVEFLPDNGIVCYGNSISLKLESNHINDSKIIRKMMFDK
jgi:hypothetical protein